MKRANPRPVVVVDGYTRFCLTALTVLLAVVALGLWADGPIAPQAGQAQSAGSAGGSRGLGNAIAQRKAIRDGIDTTNSKLDRIINLLQSGQIKVTVVEAPADNARNKPAQPAQR